MTTSTLGGISMYTVDTESRLVYYYAHMERYNDAMSPGRSIAKGDTLGYVGTTGNAPKDVPHLHFQVMRWPADGKYWNGQPIDPFQALGGLPRRGQALAFEPCLSHRRSAPRYAAKRIICRRRFTSGNTVSPKRCEQTRRRRASHARAGEDPVHEERRRDGAGRRERPRHRARRRRRAGDRQNGDALSRKSGAQAQERRSALAVSLNPCHSERSAEGAESRNRRHPDRGPSPSTLTAAIPRLRRFASE